MTNEQTKKAAIIEAAIEQFERHGFSETSMEDIAARADVSRRAIQRLFLDKRALFQAVVEELTVATLDLPLPAYTPGFPIHDQLQELIRTLFSFFGNQRTCRLLRLVIAELARQPELAGGQQRNSGAIHRRLTAWMEDAIKHGALREGSPDLAAQRLLAQTQALTLWPIMLRNEHLRDYDQPAQDITEFFLNYYGIDGR